MKVLKNDEPNNESRERQLSDRIQFVGVRANQYNYVTEKYDFRRNVVLGIFQWKLATSIKWMPLLDRDMKSLILELESEDKELKKTQVETLVESSKVSADFDPFLQYFDNLEKWDGETDYIDQLISTINTDDNDYLKYIFTKFIVGSVDCLIRDRAVNDVCLIFQGGQGIGKSRWMRKLLPPSMRKEFLYEGEINPKEKDHSLYLSQFWFIHLDELEALKSKEISSLKAFVTKSDIKLRKAFGRYTTTHIRKASFLGSVNESEFLTDTTGNRRWLVIKCKDVDYEHNVDMDKMWSQAFALLKDENYRHWFNKEEIDDINKRNEEYSLVAFEEYSLASNFDMIESHEIGEWYTCGEVLTLLANKNKSTAGKLHSPLLGKALTKVCKVTKRSQGYKRYFLRFKGIDESLTVVDHSATEGLPVDVQDDLPF